ncbi:MAG: LysR family transcriptional regulator [Lachnospiraceae bacterium]|nr:LysR family transcriptional regulator [Lachnospiraceae bacterium]
MTLNQLKYIIQIADSSSMNEAAKALFISQPSLSASVRELEDEIGLEIFVRSNRGISLTPEGKEFLGYARQVVQQYELIENRYIAGRQIKKRFSVSMQHYTFAVNAFIEVVRQYGIDEYDFSVYETRTNDVIQNVKNFKSEVGILYINEFNRKVLGKIFSENDLSFHRLFDCHIYAYVAKTHPIAKKRKVSLEELSEYPCIAFDQGENNSFYFAEELFSTYDYKRIIHASDRATSLNLFVGMNGFTLCSGIICEDLNGEEYTAVRLDSDELMTIGYIKRKGIPLSPIGELYIAEVEKYKEKVLD